MAGSEHGQRRREADVARPDVAGSGAPSGRRADDEVRRRCERNRRRGAAGERGPDGGSGRRSRRHGERQI